VVFIYGETQPGQDLFVRGGNRAGAPIRIRHRNWLNPYTNRFRWGDAYLDWDEGEVGQARPQGGLGGGSPADWTTSRAQGAGQSFVWTSGHGIADENQFGRHYWMFDVDMDCEQAFDDGQGHKWFELKAFIAQTPGWEGDIAQTSSPPPPYASKNHLGLCGQINVFVANYPGLPAGFNPNSAQFSAPSYTYLAPWDERNASSAILDGTPCVAPGIERRCVGNIAQLCQSIAGGTFFRNVENCNAKPASGNFVQLCQRSTGQCCAPGNGNNCN
jgi:hypothetical protein